MGHCRNLEAKKPRTEISLKYNSQTTSIVNIWATIIKFTTKFYCRDFELKKGNKLNCLLSYHCRLDLPSWEYASTRHTIIIIITNTIDHHHHRHQHHHDHHLNLHQRHHWHEFHAKGTLCEIERYFNYWYHPRQGAGYLQLKSLPFSSPLLSALSMIYHRFY